MECGNQLMQRVRIRSWDHWINGNIHWLSCLQDLGLQFLGQYRLSDLKGPLREGDLWSSVLKHFWKSFCIQKKMFTGVVECLISCFFPWKYRSSGVQLFKISLQIDKLTTWVLA